ncbi:MAG: nucleotide exchange factor GrpE [Polyangiaceae bacterium]
MTTDNSSQPQAANSEAEAPSQPSADAASQPSQSPEAPSAEEQLKAEVARLKDQLLRLAADFDNFRKRSRREIGDSERKAREDLLRDLLPVFDNLERATTHVSAATDVQSLAEGVQMVGKQFLDTLSRMGVERVPSVGVAFDPNIHEAIQHVETADHPPGCVAAEIVGGYKYGERLIRPAMVVVAKAPSGDKPAEPSA